MGTNTQHTLSPVGCGCNRLTAVSHVKLLQTLPCRGIDCGRNLNNHYWVAYTCCFWSGRRAKYQTVDITMTSTNKCIAHIIQNCGG